MKVFLLVTSALSGFAFAESAIPSAFARERYQETLLASPFALATPEEKKVEEKPDSPLNNLVVAGMGKLDNGQDFVIIQRIGDERSMRFEGNKPNAEGIAVKQVKWAGKWRESTVVMTHGSEEKAVEFNQSSVAAAPPVPPQGGRGPGNSTGRGGPPAPNAPPSIVPTMNTRPVISKQASITPTIPRPTSVGVPRPGGTQLPSTAGFRGAPSSNGGRTDTAVPSNGAAPRQRVRSINNR